LDEAYGPAAAADAAPIVAAVRNRNESLDSDGSD
jgi:hypothetical protein